MKRSKSWHLLTPHLMELSRAIARPHPVDKSGKPLFDSSSGLQIRTEDGKKIVRKPKRDD